MLQKYQRKLSFEEISKELNLSIEQIKDFYDNSFSYVSQNKAVGEDEDSELVDFIPDEQHIILWQNKRYGKRIRPKISNYTGHA